MVRGLGSGQKIVDWIGVSKSKNRLGYLGLTSASDHYEKVNFRQKNIIAKTKASNEVKGLVHTG